MTLPPRTRAQALAQRPDDRHTLAIPLALRLAARIQERPLDRFFTDPTQLANGLHEFQQAVEPDGLIVTDPEALTDEIMTNPSAALPIAGRAATAVEATRRLRITVGDTTALVAGLPGPATVAAWREDKREAAETTQRLVDEFLAAGIDIILLTEEEGSDLAAYEAPLRTIANMSRFHRAMACLRGARVPFMPEPTVVPLTHPTPTSGLVITERDLPTDTSITLVHDWVTTVGKQAGRPPALAQHPDRPIDIS